MAEEIITLPSGAKAKYDPQTGSYRLFQSATETSLTGDPNLDELLRVIKDSLDSLRERGQMINPNVAITPERLAEFTAFASQKIDPFFASQLKIAQEGFLRDVGFSKEDILRQEQEAEIKYGRDLRKLQAGFGTRGLAFSGLRREGEREFARETQVGLEEKRRELGFKAGTAARTFAQKFGGLQGQAFPSTPTLGAAPRVLPGVSEFARGTEEVPFYEISPELSRDLIGEEEFKRRAAVRSRTAELEGAQRQLDITSQSRGL